jgi:uncharacterized membrane-anchored protein
MKKFYTLALALTFYLTAATAQGDSTALKIQAFEHSFTYQHGAIKIGKGIGVVNVPVGFKYLDSIQAEKVLTEIWGNPKGTSKSLGFILPEKQGILSDNSYVFNIEYDPIGYVKDDDADDIDYDELLENMKSEAKEESTQRQKDGYPAVDMVGWASKPYYDKGKHILHWAKEIKFGTDSVNTLNYNVRVLGRKGVLILNAIATMNEMPAVKASIPQVLNSVSFTDGNKYTEFDSGIDNVAAWTLGGLVAGKVLAKVGFFALILKFWKLIAVAVVAGFSAIRKFLGLKKTKNAETEKELLPVDELEATEQKEEETIEPKEEEDKDKPAV